MPLRVVFAEDNYLVREGTTALLATAPEVEVVASVADSRDLLSTVAELQPDVVLTDIRMPPTYTTEGIDAARRIRADHPNVGVLVLSQHADGAYAAELLSGGAAGLGYLLKERVSDVLELVRALTEVARGGSVLDPKVVEVLLAANARERSLTAERVDRPGDRRAAGDGHRAQQRRHRQDPLPVGTSRREAHQRRLRQAGSDHRGGVAPPGKGGAHLLEREPLRGPAQTRLVFSSAIGAGNHGPRAITGMTTDSDQVVVARWPGGLLVSGAVRQPGIRGKVRKPVVRLRRAVAGRTGSACCAR